jgi:hypothetical protein
MNVTDNNRNRTNKHLSDVIIGHVKSEQFELNLTKSDNMNVHIQQVDSTTAELYLDSNFCTNESSLEINLNLSKNGKEKKNNISFSFSISHYHSKEPFVMVIENQFILVRYLLAYICLNNHVIMNNH